MREQIYAFGEEALQVLQHQLSQYEIPRVFLVRGRNSYRVCGAEAALERIFLNVHADVTAWCDFEDNPKWEDVQQGTKLLGQSSFDVIVACGGGSVMDMAKLIRYANMYEGDLFQPVEEMVANKMPLFALPTTAGTGCEATPFAVCYKDKKKYSISHQSMLPDYALICSAFTGKNPPYLTACTGFDALAQAIEAYWSPFATSLSDQYAEAAIQLIWDALPQAVSGARTILECRDALSKGAYWAGRAIAITKTTAPHAFSYAFTIYAGYPHGHAVALSFPYFAELNMERFWAEKIHPNIEVEMHGKKMEKLRTMLRFAPTGIKKQMQLYIKSLQLPLFVSGDVRIWPLIQQVNVQRVKNNPVCIGMKEMNELRLYMEENTQ